MKFATLLLVGLLACIPPFPKPHASYVTVLTIKNAEPDGMGSAFAVHSGPNYSLLVTALHVVNKSEVIGVFGGHPSVKDFDLADPVPAVVLATDPSADLALLLVPKVWPAVTIAASIPEVGTRIVGLGPTYAHGVAAVTGVVATAPGDCTGTKEAPPLPTSCFLSDMRVGPGFSGGPVVNSDNEVVGLIVAFSVVLPRFAVIVGAPRVAALLAKGRAIVRKLHADAI